MPFLLFFSLFFAMIVSDAGYGLIFVALGLFAQKKFGAKAPKEPFFLLYVLGGATMFWGLVSGNWFGAEGIGTLPIFEWALIREISAFPAEAEQAANLNFMMYLCFFIGAVHLSVAHGMRAFRYMNSPKALAEIGWIAIVWTLFFVAGTLVLGKEFPGIGMPLLIGGSALVLLFANFQKNIIKGALVTLGDLPLTIISSFSDVVSYLRLFAVGYASVTVAASFNNMAVGEGISSFVAGLMAAITLFLGHGLNIVLCLMGVIVHGVRLNMLEFSGHMNMQWSGQEYLPFRE
jgi:V/A-type H+-transporting ATPase subunit I